MVAGAPFLDRREGAVGVDVAGASAVAQFRHSVVHFCRGLVFGMRTGPEVPGVASGAIGRIGCVSIGHRLGIARVAVETGQGSGMRAGIGRRSVDIVGRRNPRGHPVAIFAADCGLEMGWGLAGCLGAVVACAAGARDICMTECRGQPGNRLVTIAAIAGGWNMRSRLAGRLGSVVACRAGSERLRVVHADGRPGSGHMAAVATVGR